MIKNQMSMVKEPTPDERLKTYRKAEEAIKTLFSTDRFCLENCISKENSLYPVKPQIPGRIACCDRNYFEEFLELDTNTPTIKKFSKMQKENATSHNHRTGECDYHSESGCQVKCYSSPLCLGYICKSYKSYLINNFAIDYTPESVNVLERILEGIEDKKEFKEWLTKIQKATERVKKGKEKQNKRQKEIKL